MRISIAISHGLQKKDYQIFNLFKLRVTKMAWKNCVYIFNMGVGKIENKSIKLKQHEYLLHQCSRKK